MPDTNHPEHNSGLTFCLVHGSWHGACSWELLRYEMEAAGHNVVTMDLPIDKPSMTYDHYADIVAQYIEEPASTSLVVHSRMGNLGPRIAQRKKTIRQVIYLAAGFDPSNNQALRNSFFSRIPDKYLSGFQDGIINHGGGLTTYDPEAASEIFYHDCPPDVAKAAAAHLRPMHRIDEQPPVTDWPRVSSALVYGRADRVLSQRYFEFIARSKKIQQTAGYSAIKLDSGHSPHLSDPSGLARVLEDLSLVCREQ